MACPKDHDRYFIRAEADRILADLIARARRTGRGGKSWKRLHVFQCGNHFHIGRSRSFGNRIVKPQPAPKSPSFGELRRKLARMEREWTRHDDRQRRQRAAAIARLVEADKQVEESKAEYLRIQREVTAMFFPA